MKFTKSMLVAALVAGSLLCDTAVFAQAGGGGGGGFGGGAGGGGRGGRGGVLTQEQTTQMRDAMQGSAEMTALTDKLTAAQKEAVNTALTAGVSDAAVQAKIEAVAKILLSPEPWPATGA